MKYLEVQEKAKLFNFFSPNIKSFIESSNSVTFTCIRYVGGDSVVSFVIFDLYTKKVLKISNYEKEYLNEVKKNENLLYR